MNLDKISLTLYDFLGYFLPGYVVVFGLSLLEATFLGGNLFSLENIEESPLIFAVAAYLLGQASHGIGSVLKEWKPRWFTVYDPRLSKPVFDAVRRGAQDAYGIALEEDEKLDTLHTYLLADSYIVASGGSSDRDILMAREGFSKATMAAFAFVSLVLWCSLLVGGVRVETAAGTVHLTWAASLALAAVSVALTLVFRRGFGFFGRVKINNTLLVFLAQYRRDLMKQKE